MDSVQTLACGDNPRILGDAARLHQVFVNLLENSLRYTRPGGMLQLQAWVEGALDSRELLICFDDSAPCPAPQDLPRLFERFIARSLRAAANRVARDWAWRSANPSSRPTAARSPQARRPWAASKCVCASR